MVCRFEKFRKLYVVRPTVGGTREDRKSGVRLFCILMYSTVNSRYVDFGYLE